MAADEVLNLFDSIWFGSSSCFSTMTKTTTTTTKTNPSEDFNHDQEEQIFPEDLMIQESLSSKDHDHHLSFSPFPNHLNVRSQSEHLLEYSSSKGSFFSDSQFSPSSVLNLNTPKLQTIISGKEVRDFLEEEGSNYRSTTTEEGRRKIGASSKSLSDLEFEELKGFMDLGFVFTKEECRDSNLISIIPGLQRFAAKKQSDVIGPNNRGKDHDQGSSVSRPYLSEAWDVLDIRRKKEKSPLMNWKLTETGSEIDMKDQLKFWAHSVASTVDPRAVQDGDSVTVYVSTEDPRESVNIPPQVNLFAGKRLKARINRDNGKAKELHDKIINSGYRVLKIDDKEILARKYRIRLRGIDAPEHKMPYGDEAKDELTKLVQGKCLSILVYGEDQYGRTVGDIYCNGIFVQEVMLKKGCAWHYVTYDKRPQLARWEKEARAKKVGLWASSNPEKPWIWRRNNPRTDV